MLLNRREAMEKLVREDPHYRLETIERTGLPWRVYANAPSSLRAVLESTEAFGTRPFLVYEEERWTFADHFRIVSGLAQRWQSLGVGKGDRVAIVMRNFPEWVMTFWAVQALGGIVVPLNAWWTGPELRYALHDSEPKMLVADGERIERLAPHLGELGIGRVLAVRACHEVPAGVIRWEDELQDLDPEAKLPDVAVGPDDDATVMYTSGTMGVPKGAIATQRNHITNLRNTEFNGAVAVAMAGIELPDELPQTNMLQTFPFFHIGGLSGLYIGTAFGAKLCLMYKWDTEEAAEIIQRESINAASMVPTLLRQLLEYAERNGLRFETLSGMSTGGAPVPPDLIRLIGRHFEHRVSPANGYGLTETTSAIVMNSGDEYFAHPDSVGRLMPGADLRVVFPEIGETCAVSEIGELWFRGPNVVRGYWNKLTETAAAFTDGWFHSGDLGYIDMDGLVYVVDRLKDVVIRAGENVYCAEVEAVLFEHPDVDDVAIIGLPHPSWGEEVAAAVHRRAGGSATARDLQVHVASRLASFKVPTQIYFVDDDLPRTATGKLLKRELRERFGTLAEPSR